MNSEKGAGPSAGGFFSRLRRKRIPEILAGFIGGGWLILEFVHWILIDHYHLPENLLDITFITLFCALACTLAWRVFGGQEQRHRKFKVELLLIPLFILVAAYVDIRLFNTWGKESPAAAAETEAAASLRPKVNPTRAVVATFENMTGDPSLDIIGRIAADWVTQGISRIPGLEVSPAAADRPAEGSGKPARAGADIQALSRATGAGTVVTGAYFLNGENLEFRFQVIDAIHSKILQSMAGIKGTLASRMEAIDILSRRVMGAMVDLLDRGMEAPSVVTPPLYEAYHEYVLGLDAFGADYGEADKHFARAAELDPGFPFPALYLAVGLANRKEYAKADRIYRRLDLQRDEIPPYLRHVLDWAKADIQGRSEDALRSIREALRLLPSNLTLIYLVGDVAITANRPQEAIDVYSTLSGEDRKSIYTMPTGFWLIGNLTGAYHMLGQHDKELETVRAEKPFLPGILDVRSYEIRALAALGRADEIAEVIEESLATASVFGTAGGVMLAAAAELREHGERDLSLSYARKAVEWYRDNGKESVSAFGEVGNLATALYSAEQWGEALHLVRQASLKEPANIDLLGRLGTLAVRLGNTEEARRISGQLKAIDRPFLFGGTSYRRARIAALLGERDQAVSLLREAFAQGLGYSIQILRDMDLEPLWDYGPFKELMKPKS